jgi:hypothetical protein
MGSGGGLVGGCGLFVIGAFVAALACGCAGDGSGLDQTGAPAGGNPLLAQLQAGTFSQSCALSGCHTGSGAPFGLRLDSAENAVAGLVNIPSQERPDLLRVDPGDPVNSYLVLKVEGNPAAGSRMPLGLPPLPQGQVDAIRQWILAGAPGP